MSKVLKLICFSVLSKVLKRICFSVLFILRGAAWGPWAQAPLRMKKTEKQISLRIFDTKVLNPMLLKGS